MIDWQAKVLSPLVAVFGQPAIFTRASEHWAVEYAITGIFDEAYEDIELTDGLQVVSKVPCLGINLADLPFVPKQKDKILIAAQSGAPKVTTRYIVKKVQEDGHGGCRLLLNVAPVTKDLTDPQGTQDQ